MVNKLSDNVRPTDNCYVRVKKTGDITEIRWMQHQTKASIQRIDKDNYCLLKTGEVFENSHAQKRIDNKPSVRKSLHELRDIINTNVNSKTEPYCRWTTFTYAENMLDPNRLYADFKHFMPKFRNHCKKQYGSNKVEYISCAEPQARGAWHLHVIFIFDYLAPYLDNSILQKLWGHGFTSIKALHGVDNVGCYLTAYLTDMELTDALQAGKITGNVTETTANGKKLSKAIVKGERLKLYPAKFRIYRTSRGIARPKIRDCLESEAQAIVGNVPLVFEKTIEVLSENAAPCNIINYRQYNKARKAIQVGITDTSTP